MIYPCSQRNGRQHIGDTCTPMLATALLTMANKPGGLSKEEQRSYSIGMQHNRAFSYKGEWNLVTCKKVDGVGARHVKKWARPRKTSIIYFLLYGHQTEQSKTVHQQTWKWWLLGPKKGTWKRRRAWRVRQGRQKANMFGNVTIKPWIYTNICINNYN